MVDVGSESEPESIGGDGLACLVPSCTECKVRFYFVSVLAVIVSLDLATIVKRVSQRTKVL